jgi:hypothetical protein
MEKLYSPSYVAAVHKRMHILHTVFNGGSRLFKESLPLICSFVKAFIDKIQKLFWCYLFRFLLH